MIYVLTRAVCLALFKVVWRPVVVGRDNIPADGPVILASNHLSFIDSIAIPVVAPRRVQFLAKSSYFDGPGLGGWISRTFFTSIGAVAVERGAGAAAQEALDAGRRILETESAFAIYPEGTRSLDGRLYRGRTGVAWLALTTGAPVVPVGLIGTDELMPVGSSVPKLKRVTVVFGEPLHLDHHGPATSGRARRAATDDIMNAIHALTGQDRADAYNESPPADTIEKLKRAVFQRERL